MSTSELSAPSFIGGLTCQVVSYRHADDERLRMNAVLAPGHDGLPLIGRKGCGIGWFFHVGGSLFEHGNHVFDDGLVISLMSDLGGQLDDRPHENVRQGAFGSEFNCLLLGHQVSLSAWPCTRERTLPGVSNELDTQTRETRHIDRHLRDMMQVGENPRQVLRAGPGLSPEVPRKLRLFAGPADAADRQKQ